MPLTIALLDSGPLGLVTHPNATPEAHACKTWLSTFLEKGHSVLVPEITYYETRRELRRSEMKHGVKSKGLANLEIFVTETGLVPITSDVIVLATEFWAEARHKHLQGAPDSALDADMILCAQATLLKPESWNLGGADVTIATTNVKHLIFFTKAQNWKDIEG